MLRRTFLGTLAAIPIIGIPLRAFGRAVPYETSRLTITWTGQDDAPDIVIVLYSDESVRCWLGDTELTSSVAQPPIQQCQRWWFVGSDGTWSVDVKIRRQDFETIDVERIVMWMGVGVEPRADPHFGLDQHPVSTDYGIGHWIDLNNS